MQSESISKLAAALCKAQGQIKNPKKDAKHLYLKYEYADLSSVIEAIKEPFSKNGLSYIQYVEKDLNNDRSYLYTQLMHDSGEWWRSGGIELIITKIEKGAEKTDMQTLGSAITYARRYSLTMVAGVYQEDDDGAEACGQVNTKPGEKWKNPILNAKPSVEWRPSKVEYEIIAKLAEQKGWPHNAIGSYIKNNFKGKEKFSELSQLEYQTLVDAISESVISLKEEVKNESK